MGKTFTLTTPLTGGPKSKDSTAIKAFQRQLKSDGYYTGAIDGIYGQGTAKAAYMAKSDLGYSKPDHSAGDMLYGYLTGKLKPTQVMIANAKARKAIQNKLTPVDALAEKALQWYIKNTGMKESPPNSNHCPVTEWYGATGPWCAMAGVMGYSMVGSKVFTRANSYKYNWAYVENIVHDARLGLHGLKTATAKTVMPGYGICFDWPGETPGLADHFGVFEKWINKSAGVFLTREGNTAIGNNSNGGEIMQRQRDLDQVRQFVIISG